MLDGHVRPPGLTDRGSVPALLLAAAFTLLIARALPIEFTYVPNDLGIISIVSQMEYPIQQETFWLAFATLVGLVLACVLASRLERAPSTPCAAARFEVLAFCAPVSAVWLPTSASLAFCTAVSALLVWISRRGEHSEAKPGGSVPPIERSRLSLALWFVVFIALATIPRPNFWFHLWNFASGVPDRSLTSNNFRFLAESGQHLAWANEIWNGGFQGRDFFCLYGPFFDLGLVGFWALVGRSIAAWNLYWALSQAAGWLCLFAVTAAVVRNRFVILALPFIVPYVQLRVGLALLALLFFVLWLRTDRRRWALASGATAACSVLYSQEYGGAFLVAAAVGFAVCRRGRALMAFAGGFGAISIPCAGFYAVHGALGPLMRDIATYPGLVISGYANLPFPALLPSLPLDITFGGLRLPAITRLAYAVPAVCVAGIALSLGACCADWRRPVAALRATATSLERDPLRVSTLLIAIFGLLAYRAALGRSDLPHIQAAMPGAAVLVCVGIDRVLALWRSGFSFLPLASVRTILLAIFVGCGGFLETTPSPVAKVARSFHFLKDLTSPDVPPVGSEQVEQVVRWVETNTDPGEPVLFVPNDAAYYYLTNRPNPIRFVLGHQIAGDAHRREVLEDLQRSPPRTIVWDDAAYAVDDIPHASVFGADLIHWIESNYDFEVELGAVRILRRLPLRADP